MWKIFPKNLAKLVQFHIVKEENSQKMDFLD